MEEAILSGQHCLRRLALTIAQSGSSRGTASYVCTTRDLMHRALRAHARIELDLSEGALVTGHVLLQKSQ
jgi:hypothetical protein